MEQLSQYANANGMTGTYRLPDIEAANDDLSCPRSLWDKFLGITTMVGVSVGGWTAIIELIRLMR
jgi:hypothetical protein